MAEEGSMHVFFQNGYLCLERQDDDSLYSVSLDRCNNYEEILGWAYAIAEEEWSTPEAIERFIEVACSGNGLPIPRP